MQALMCVGVAKALVYTPHVLLMGSSVAAYNDDNADGASYVALEPITVTVRGRAGGFSRLHLGTMVGADTWARCGAESPQDRITLSRAPTDRSVGAASGYG